MLGDPPTLWWLPGQGQRVWAPASQAGSALTLLEDEDAVSIALPSPGCSCSSIRKGWQDSDTRQGSCWTCSHKSPLPSDSALPEQGRPLQGVMAPVGSPLNPQPLGQ